MATKTGTITKPTQASTITGKNSNKETSGASDTSTVAADASANGETVANADNIKGRSVFSIETTAAGVVVRTAFLTEDERVLEMPAVFPDMVYALNVIDELKRQVTQHFSQAAQVGAQVIANQARAQKTAQQTDQQTSQEESQASASAAVETKQVETVKK
ncbi:MAG: hypothetical protein R6V42_08630 [Orrella sp.]